MKNRIIRKTIIVLCLIMAIALPVVPCSAAAKDNVQSAAMSMKAAKKDKIVLKKKKGKYYCYKNGKLAPKSENHIIFLIQRVFFSNRNPQKSLRLGRKSIRSLLPEKQKKAGLKIKNIILKRPEKR